MTSTVDGLVVVDKPPGMTSHDVVNRCRRLFGQRRVGHSGTLDPDATGVLVVGLGRATRLMQYMGGLTKGYSAEIVTGTATSTLDGSGETTGRWDMSAVTIDDARAAASRLTGTVWQVPPMVSAVKVGGKRLHQLARAGVEVERQPRQVTVQRFDLEPSGISAYGPVFHATVECSSGTYVRVLAADLGTALGGGAHLRALRRTAVGPWTEQDALPLERLCADAVIPPADALPWLEAAQVDADTADAVRHGKVLAVDELEVSGPGPWRVLGPGQPGQLLAVYEPHRPGWIKPRVVLDGAC